MTAPGRFKLDTEGRFIEGEVEGSWSHGTHRPEDLMNAFSPLLKAFIEGIELLEAFGDLLDMDGDIEEGYEEHASELLDEAFTLLNEVAPEGYYFGALEGDGSDFGYWREDGMDEYEDEG